MLEPTTKTVTTETTAKASDDPDSPMTGDQADLLRSLCEEASEPFDGSLTQRQALERIETLRDSTNNTL